jgi:2-amino-4-hydroxy-6-hydroxymethyldihydropteridine diphosphokinase
MIHYVVGVGASGPRAVPHVLEGVRLLRAHPFMHRVVVSPLYGNPAVGGGTTASFVNGAVVVDSPLGPRAFLRALFAVEERCGRLRTRPLGPRTLDLDVLLAYGAARVPLRHPDHPCVPHPRLTERAFALIPALEALAAAGLPLDDALARAAAACPGRAQLVRVAEALHVAIDPESR